MPALLSVVVVAAVATSFATGAAQSLFTVIQPDRVGPLYVERGELASLPAIRKFGVIHMPAKVKTKQVWSMRTATRLAGRHILVPSYLPASVPSRHMYEVFPAEKAWFRFSRSRTARYALTSGRRIPRMPAYINGSVLTLKTYEAVLTVYGSRASIPSLVVGQSRVPRLTMRGTTLSSVEAYLASVPGVPKQLVSELSAMASTKSTLPIPVPINWAYAQEVTVHGASGLVVGDNTGVASFVVWEKNGIVHGVGGALTSTDALKIANSLH